jgi:hypothetical protein
MALELIADYWEGSTSTSLRGQDLVEAKDLMVDLFRRGLAPDGARDDKQPAETDDGHLLRLLPQVEEYMDWAKRTPDMGAAGPDGWAAAELRDIPQETWQAFRLIATVMADSSWRLIVFISRLKVDIKSPNRTSSSPTRVDVDFISEK